MTRTTPPPRLAQAALAAAGTGLYVFPVWPWGKTPAVTDWENAATLDPDQISRWWEQRPFNIGVAVGRSGVLVIDLDPAHGAPPPPEWLGAIGGWDVLSALADQARVPLPDTFTVATPSGGRHLYFRQPAGAGLRNTQGEAGRGLGWRIDVRGHGGFVVGAGSRRRDGLYRVTRPVAIAALPGWIVTALTPPPPAPRPERPPGELPAAPERITAYVDAVVRAEVAAVAAATLGTRHWVLLRAARKLGHWVGGGLLDDQRARDELTAAAAHYDNPRKTAQTITDGLAYGADRPRTAEDIVSRTTRP